MVSTELEFLYDFARARAQRIVEIPGGAVVRSAAYPAAHDHNMALVQRAAAQAAAVVDAIEHASTDLHHRHVEIAGDAASRQLAAALAAAGYQHSRDVVMTLRRPPPEPGCTVVELSVEERIAVASAGWAAEQPDWDADVPRQLGERIRTALDAAACTFLAVRSPDGRVCARADRYVRADVAQVEEVITDEAYRGRGFASALVAVAAGRAATPTVFLVADAQDGPVRLYERLGFEVTAHREVWTRDTGG